MYKNTSQHHAPDSKREKNIMSLSSNRSAKLDVSGNETSQDGGGNDEDLGFSYSAKEEGDDMEDDKDESKLDTVNEKLTSQIEKVNEIEKQDKINLEKRMGTLQTVGSCFCVLRRMDVR